MSEAEEAALVLFRLGKFCDGFGSSFRLTEREDEGGRGGDAVIEMVGCWCRRRRRLEMQCVLLRLGLGLARRRG